MPDRNPIALLLLHGGLFARNRLKQWRGAVRVLVQQSLGFRSPASTCLARRPTAGLMSDATLAFRPGQAASRCGRS
jgi:hypothetical protein